MKKLMLICFFAFSFSGKSQVQNLDQYKYVQVPKAYDFLKEADQYQLNALTAFLFEKEGFEVFYLNELPAGLDGCKMLKADVVEDSGMFSTRVQLKLENCKGETVFTSKMGESRMKEFKDAYHEALRDAFTSFDQLDYAYSESAAPVSLPNVPQIIETTPPQEAVAKKLNAEKAIEEAVPAEAIPEAIMETESQAKPEGSFFRNGAVRYSLKENAAGYKLFRGEAQEEFASLLKSGGGSNYIFTSEKLKGNAYFDARGNLFVEYLDTNTEQLVTVKYELLD